MSAGLTSRQVLAATRKGFDAFTDKHPDFKVGIIVIADCQIVWQVNGGRAVLLLNNVEEVFLGGVVHM